jgi:hypothetical protein
LPKFGMMKERSAIGREHLVWMLVLAVYAAWFFAMPINLSTADLGRHITNGALLMQGVTEVLHTNHYSFTESDHPFTNHHWLSGVVMHLVHRLFDFKGLSILYIILSVASLLLMARASARGVNAGWGLLFAMLAVPLFGYRTEVRPEGFSYLLLAVYYLLMCRHREGMVTTRQLVMWLLPLQLLWVNLHIFFFLGLGVVGIFWLDSLLFQEKKERANGLLKLILGMLAISLFNPHLHRGLLAPLTIFEEYGYMVLENQTVFFLQNRFGWTGSGQFLHTELLGIIIVLAVGWAVVKGRWRDMVPEIALSLFFLALSLMAVRGIPMLALFSIPLLSRIISQLMEELHFNTRKQLERGLPIAGIVLCMAFMGVKGTYVSADRGYNGLGLVKDIDKSGRFLRREHIPGNMFNNYDIGSYLIFYLHEREKVFVDNRPEAYSVHFFDSIYRPMQYDEDFFREMVKKYDLNIICFYRHDNTEWGQPFLIRRTQDPDWVPIYVDGVSLILVRNLPRNADWINRFALPRSMFVAIPT